MSLDPSTLAVCLVTDAGQCAAAGRSVAATVADAVANGVGFIGDVGVGLHFAFAEFHRN